MRSVNDSVETVNAAASAIVSAESRVQPTTVQVHPLFVSTIDFFSLWLVAEKSTGNSCFWDSLSSLLIWESVGGKSWWSSVWIFFVYVLCLLFSMFKSLKLIRDLFSVSRFLFLRSLFGCWETKGKVKLGSWVLNLF